MAESSVVYIEHCVGCEGHAYHTRHKSQLYLQNFEATTRAIVQACPQLQVTANEVFQDAGTRNTESRWGGKSQGKLRFPRVGAFEVYFRGRKVFSKLEAGMWPSPETVASRVKRICDGVEPASPERSQPSADPYHTGFAKRPSPARHAPDLPVRPKTTPKDDFPTKSNPREEEKRVAPSKLPGKVNRYSTPSDKSLQERPKTPGEVENRGREVVRSTENEGGSRKKEEKTEGNRESGQQDRKELEEENRAKPSEALPEKPQEPPKSPTEHAKPPPEASRPPLERSEESKPPPDPPSERAKTPPQLPEAPSEPVKSAEQDEKRVESPHEVHETEEKSYREEVKPAEDSAATPASAASVEKPEEEGAAERHRDDEELDQLFPEEKITQEIEVALPLGTPSEQEMPYENHSESPEEIAVKSSNAALVRVKHPQFTVAAGEAVVIALEFAGNDQETEKSCMLYISVNGKVKECIQFHVIYSSQVDAEEYGDEEDEYGQEEDGESPMQCYEIQLPVGVKTSKQIKYSNDEEDELAIEVSSSDPTYMEVKETHIVISPGSSGKIKLSFPEVSEPCEKELFLFIHYQGELRETIQIRASYVVTE